MRPVIAILLILAMAGSALASDLGSTRDQPAKPSNQQTYENPIHHKQGGDTIEDAFPIVEIPFYSTGTTTGYVDDYDVMCPYGGMAPDVVYSFHPDQDVVINIDLCGSAYDTKVYVVDSAFTIYACNDDFYFDDICGEYVSYLEGVSLMAGVTYYIVVDGYSSANGQYILDITEFDPCYLTCPAEAVDEGEPPLHDGYIDNYNRGCGSSDPGEEPFQLIDWINVDPTSPLDGQAWMCGASGWFTIDGAATRDTDWFRVYALQTGVMEWTVESEHAVYMFKLAPLDCASVGVELNATADCEAPATLTFPVTEGEEIWLWVGPTEFQGPVTEFPYFMTVSNNTFDVVPTERANWGGVKALYR